MNLETICTLSYGNNYEDIKIIEVDDRIKVFLHNGEILIGEFEESDSSSLFIERDCDSINIMFVDVENIEKLGKED